MQTYSFSTLYTCIQQKLLKSRMEVLVQNSFNRRDGSTPYTHIKVGQGKGCFVHFISIDGENMYTADQIFGMIDFLFDSTL